MRYLTFFAALLASSLFIAAAQAAPFAKIYQIDKAHKVLIRAAEKSDKEVLKRNRDLLANNKVNHFNNSGFGEEWYMLGLEEPKIKEKRQRFPSSRPF